MSSLKPTPEKIKSIRTLALQYAKAIVPRGSYQMAQDLAGDFVLYTLENWEFVHAAVDVKRFVYKGVLNAYYNSEYKRKDQVLTCLDEEYSETMEGLQSEEQTPFELPQEKKTFREKLEVSASDEKILDLLAKGYTNWKIRNMLQVSFKRIERVKSGRQPSKYVLYKAMLEAGGTIQDIAHEFQTTTGKVREVIRYAENKKEKAMLLAQE